MRARYFLLYLCDELGVLVNLSKSSLTPTQSNDYLGMTLQSTPLKAFLTQARIQKVLSLVDEFSSSREQPLSLWQSLLGVTSSMTLLISGARVRMQSLQLRLNVAGPQIAEHALISWDDSWQKDLWWWSDASHLVWGVSRPPSTMPPSLYGRVRLWVGSFAWRQPPVQLVDSGHISLFDQTSRASGSSLGGSGFPSSSEWSFGVVVHGQHLRSGLPAQGRGYPFIHPQLGSAVHPSPLRVQRCSSAPQVCSWEAQRLGGFFQSGFPSLGL